MKKINILVFVILFLSAHLLFAQGASEKGVDLKKTGQSTMNFLQVGVVPNAVSLGEAYTAIGTGVQGMFYNPAGLAEMNSSFEVFASSMEWIADIQ